MSAVSSSVSPALAPPPAELDLFPAPCPHTVSAPSRYDQPAAFLRPRSSLPARCLLPGLATFLAVAAVVFLLSECLVRRVPATSGPVRRRLAGGEGGGDKEGLGDEGICEALNVGETEGDGTPPEEPPRVTRSGASHGGRRQRAHPRRRRPLGKTLATLRILESLFPRDEKQTESRDSEEPVSQGGSSKASPGTSSSTPEEDEQEEEWKGPGKPDHLLEMFMQRARTGAAATQRHEVAGLASQASTSAATVSSAAPAEVQHPPGSPPRKRARGSDAEGELEAPLHKAMHFEKTSARRTLSSEDSPIALKVAEEHSSGSSSIDEQFEELLLEGETADPSSDIMDVEEFEALQFLDAYLGQVLEEEASGLLADWILEPSQGIPSELFRESIEAEAHAESHAPFESSEGGGAMSLMVSAAPPEYSETVVSPRQGTGATQSTDQRSELVLGSSSRGVSTGPGQQKPSSSAEILASSSSLQPTPSSSTGGIYESHPLYRLPEPYRGAFATSDYLKYHFVWKAEDSFHRLVNRIRLTLTKPVLDKLDVAELFTSGETLARYASKYLSRPLESRWSAQLVGPMASRFLVAHCLFGIREVLGLQWGIDIWAPSLMDKLLAPPSHWKYKDGIDEGGHSEKNFLVQKFVDAFAAFRSGFRPGADETIWLMRHIFSRSYGMYRFQGPEWNGWREADDEFVKSQKASGQLKDDEDM
ncbi:hypothetical protein Emed_004281 [Eimeria media]